MTSVTLPAYAKVNLYLEVLRIRADCTHELLTLFERIDLYDQLTVEIIGGATVELLCQHPDVPRDATNLVVKAALGFFRASRWSPGIRIHLTKNIPVSGGLGGGSSDAASTLMALQVLSGGRLKQEQLLP